MNDTVVRPLYVAHECNKAGFQALSILRARGADTEVLHGSDPCAPNGSCLFLTISCGSFSSKFLRIPGATPRYEADLERQRYIAEYMPWTRGANVIFIVPKFLSPQGTFSKGPLTGFTNALERMMGYREPSAEERKADRVNGWRSRKNRSTYLAL